MALIGDDLANVRPGSKEAARVKEAPDMMLLCTLAAEAVAQATVQAVRQAQALRLGDGWWPAARDLR